MGFADFVNMFQKVLWSVCLSVSTYHKDKYLRISGFSPIHFRSNALSQIEANHLLPRIHCAIKKMAEKVMKWKFIEVMSSNGKDYRRISGLAKPPAKRKTEVRFYSTLCVHYVARVVNTSKYVLTKSGSRLYKTWLWNAGTCCCYGL